MKYPRIILSILILIAPPVWAEELTVEEQFDRFNLWNWCQPFNLLVEYLSNDAKKIGLTRERIQTAVESRLRGTRIFSDDDLYPHFYVQVSVVGSGFSISFYFTRWMEFIDMVERVAPEETPGPYYGTAYTWSYVITGTHGKDAGYILQHVYEGTDNFINEYLRVNEEACK